MCPSGRHDHASAGGISVSRPQRNSVIAMKFKSFIGFPAWLGAFALALSIAACGGGGGGGFGGGGGGDFGGGGASGNW